VTDLTVGVTYLAGEGDPAERIVETCTAELRDDQWVVVVRDGAGEVIEERAPDDFEAQNIAAATAPAAPEPVAPEDVPAALADAEARIAELEAQIAAILAALGQ